MFASMFGNKYEEAVEFLEKAGPHTTPRTCSTLAV
jgi:hypothetical protein